MDLAALHQQVDDLKGGFLGTAICGRNDQLRVVRPLVRVGDACKVGNFTRAGFFVESFGIALLAQFDRRVDKNFQKISVVEERANPRAVGFVGAHETCEKDEACIDEKFADFSDAADVFGAVLG